MGEMRVRTLLILGLIASLLAPASLRAADPVLDGLRARDPERRRVALEALLADPAAATARVDVIEARGAGIEVVRSVTITGDNVNLTSVAVSADGIFVADAGRRYLALADQLVPHLELEAGLALFSRRRELGPQVVMIRPVPDALQYDRKEFTVLAGKPVEIIFTNVDIMPHNLVIGTPGTLAKVGRAGEAMASETDAWERSYIPEIEIDQVFGPEDFFNLQAVEPGPAVQIGDLSFEFRRTRHSVPTMGFRVSHGGRSFGYSCDTTYDPAYIDFLAQTDLIFHDCNESVIHTPYADLLTIDRPVRDKIHILHLADTFDRQSCELPIVETGRLYTV